MYHIGDVVVYGSEGVCEVKEITEVRFGKDTTEYYVLSPVMRDGDTFYVPTKNDMVLSKLRPTITKGQAEKLLKLLPVSAPEWNNNERERIKSYKEILLYGSSEELMGMTKQLYMHQISQLEKGKKLHACDERFLKDAERILFDELSYVMGVSREEIVQIIVKSEEGK